MNRQGICLYFLLSVSILNSQVNHKMRKHVFTSVHWECRLSNKISTILTIVSLKYMISPKLIWYKLNFIITQKNSLHFSTLYISKSRNITNALLFSSLCIHDGSKHIMVLRSCDLGLRVSRLSAHSL